MDIRISGIEYYLPPRTEDRKVLLIDNPDWRLDEIEAKTGVFTRHIAEPDETAVDIGFYAAEKLLKKSKSSPEIDFLLLVTQSPDYLLPSSSCILQDRLGLPLSCMAFDVNQGCSGFVYALAIGGSLIESRLATKGIIICSETYTKYIEKNDRTCRPLFSDGAAAVLVERSETDELGPFDLGTDGSGFRSLIVPLSGARVRTSESEKRRLFMSGAEVFMFTMDKVPQCVNVLLKKAKKSINDIDLFVFHQASKLVFDNIIRRLELPPEKVYINCNRVGNTVSASIPIALRDAADEGRLSDNNLVMLIGFGVGLSWAGCLLRWRDLS